MTICVAIKVHECLVFAADSALSYSVNYPDGTAQIVNVYGHGNKVFNLVKGLPISAMFCGMGNIGRASISSIAKDLRRELTTDADAGGLDRLKYTVEEVAIRARQMIFERHYSDLAEKPAGPHSLEFFVGGYSAGSDRAEVWKIVLMNGDCEPPFQQFPGTDLPFVVWAGQPEALNRLLLGFSGRLGEALEAGGLDPNLVGPTLDHVRSFTGNSLAEDAMPTGDAIALAEYLVDVTKGYVHFLRGADTVGGDTDIAVVTRHEGFRWIKRKHFYPRELNLETDHA